MANYMTKSAANLSLITLPLLVDYVDALLPSLTTQTNTTVDQVDNRAKLLWVAQDDDAHLALKSQLKNQKVNQSHDKVIKDTQNLQTSTLSALSQQQLPERYELACFWLPSLSKEQLQHYIPLLMRYRDLYASHLLIALDNNIDLKAYGFTPFDILDNQRSEADGSLQANSSLRSDLPTAILWQFNLYDYKQLPNWLNADYWANPENWDKRRW